MITTRRRPLLAAALLGALIPSTAMADEVDDALRVIGEARASVKTLTAAFVQVRAIDLLATEVTSRGKMWLVRPDRLRWELEPPDAVTYWIGPDGIAVRSGDGVTRIGKAAAGRFGAVLGDLMVLVGGDLGALRKRYDLTVERKGKSLTLTATPRAPEVRKALSRLRMVADTDALWRLRRVEIHEASGDSSEITFTSFSRNEPIDPKIMEPPTK